MLSPLFTFGVFATLSTQAVAQLTFGPRILVGTTTPEDGLLAIDYDGDGDRDLITFQVQFVSSYDVVLLERTADGGLLTPALIGLGPTGSSVAASLMDDIDGDGLLDLLVATADRTIQLHRGLPGGLLDAAEVLLPGTNRVSKLAVGDVDQDGDLDVAFVEGFSSQVRLLRQGALGFTQEVLATGVSGSRDLELHDLDDDGDLDIVGLLHNQDSVFMMRGDVGSFAPPEVIATGIEAPERLEVVDLVGDSGLDIVVTGGFSNQLWRLRNVQLATSWVAELIDPVADAPFNVQIEDMNDDGILDIVTTPSTGRGPTLYLGDGQGGVIEHFVNLDPFNARMNLVLDDIDQDGDQDMIIWSAFDESDIYQVTQTTPFGTAFCTGVVNSTGGVSTLSGSGSQQIELNDLRLTANGLPVNTFGLFIASRSTRSPFVPAGGVGRLCIGDSSGAGIGRLDGPGQVLNSGSTGRFFLSPSLASLPTGLGTVHAISGET